jgi:homoserine dehydrogenase
VGAGLPVLSTLRDLVETGDQVTRIEVRGGGRAWERDPG